MKFIDVFEYLACLIKPLKNLYTLEVDSEINFSINLEQWKALYSVASNQWYLLKYVYNKYWSHEKINESYGNPNCNSLGTKLSMILGT